MKYTVRKFEDDTLPLVVESDDPIYAPDEAARHVGWTSPGQVVFLEVREFGSDGPWALWRVECVNLPPYLMLQTVGVTVEEAREEIAKAKEGMS